MAEEGSRLPFLILSPALQMYAWGRVGSQSQACQLKQCSDTDFQVDEQQTYAELWMGTHKKGPAKIKFPDPLLGTLLSDWLNKNPWALGGRVGTTYDGQLPFLFKVLSINTALSIQAHPDKARAARLHSEQPQNYPDSNHKPEMVIAYVDFEGLCGFRRFKEIRLWLGRVEELQKVLGQSATDRILKCPDDQAHQVEATREGFTSLINADPDLLHSQLDEYVAKLNEKKEQTSLDLEERLVRTLHQQYPGDAGCFCVFFLNPVQLSPGQAMFLPANEPHCYITGEVIECMACSDNVVRAGLTIKYKDRDTLCEMMTYEGKSFENFQVLPQTTSLGDGYSHIFDPPIPEFAVARVAVPCAVKDFSLATYEGPSLILIFQGNLNMTVSGVSHNVARGAVIFLPAGHTANFVQRDTGEKPKDVLMYRAFCA